jgi:hypothetical protein
VSSSSAHGVGRSRTESATYRVRMTAAVLAVAASALIVVGTSAEAGAATASAEVLVAPGTTRALASGGSATPYGVDLPTGASCPGDTAHHGYHVFSYLVPEATSPTDVSFKTGVPNKGYGYIADGAYYGAVNTDESTGLIVGIPTSFVWTRLTPRMLFSSGARSSTWNGGIACADTHGNVTNYWNSTIVFTADASDPGGFTWKAVNQGTVPSSFPVGLWVGVALLVVAAGAAAYALNLRRGGRAADAGPEAPDVDGPDPGGDDGPGEGAAGSLSDVAVDTAPSEAVGR